MCSAKSLHEMCDVFSVSQHVSSVVSSNCTTCNIDTGADVAVRKKRKLKDGPGGEEQEIYRQDLLPDQRCEQRIIAKPFLNCLTSNSYVADLMTRTSTRKNESHIFKSSCIHQQIVINIRHLNITNCA